jgi:signal peptidase I
VSDHWDWNRPGVGDEDEQEQDEQPEQPDQHRTDPPLDDPGGWPQDEPDDGNEQGGWPAPGAGRQQTGYGDYGGYQDTNDWYRSRYGDHEYSPKHEVPELEDTEDPWPEHPSRDPLARLFPGLPRSVRVTLDWILTIAGAIIIVFALKLWVVNPYRIPSSSMEPTLNCAKGPAAVGCLGDSSDRVLACRICLAFGRNPSRSDIVVFNTPTEAALKCGEGGTFVKRVIGLPGETVKEDDNGFIWVRKPGAKNFFKLKEPYLTASRRLADSAHFGEVWHVPANSYFMMGDNRSQSCDSRTWGSVPRNKLIGIVFFVYWPPDRIGFR